MGDREKTLYVVLWLDPDRGWYVLDRTRANNPLEACKTVALTRVDTETSHDGQYVAVAASSWRPVDITLETQTVAKVGAA